MNLLMIINAFRELLPEGPEIDFDAVGLPILLGGFVAIVVVGAVIIILGIVVFRSLLRRRDRER